MVTQTNLVVVGKKGFELVDEMRRERAAQPYSVPCETRELEAQFGPRKGAMDCYQAARVYGGVVLISSPNYRESIDCDEAANIYGGTLIKDGNAKVVHAKPC